MSDELNTFEVFYRPPNTTRVNPYFMENQVKAVSRTFNVEFTEPKDESKGRKWALNRNITVCAESVDTAIQIVRREFPEGEIHKVIRANSIHFFS